MLDNTRVDQNYADNYRHLFILYSKVIKFQYIIEPYISNWSAMTTLVPLVLVLYSRCQDYGM